MPKLSNIFSSQLLRAADLADGPRDVTISGWREEYLYGKNEYVLELYDETRGLRLTASLTRDIGAALDEDDLDALPGRAIRIYPDQMKIPDKETGEKKLVDHIRAMKSDRDRPPPKPLNSPPDDDIPF
jgi:hypothetical protein